MRRRVLVIEDDEDLGDALREMIALLGHDVVVANTGAKGCLLARAFAPDIIFCDLGLPEMDGYATAQALRADPVSARAFIVALSGHSFSPRPRPGDCFDQRIMKPVGGEALEQILAAI